MLARIAAEGVARSGNARRERQGVRHDSGATGRSCQGRLFELVRQLGNVSQPVAGWVTRATASTDLRSCTIEAAKLRGRRFFTTGRCSRTAWTRRSRLPLSNRPSNCQPTVGCVPPTKSLNGMPCPSSPKASVALPRSWRPWRSA